MDSERKELLIIIFILTRCAFCFEFDVVFRLPSLLGLLDEFGDCMLSDPVWPLMLGRDTELLRELPKKKYR